MDLLTIRYGQWPFQEPKLKVPTIYNADFLGHSISGNIPTIHMAKHMVLTNVPPSVGS